MAKETKDSKAADKPEQPKQPEASTPKAATGTGYRFFSGNPKVNPTVKGFGLENGKVYQTLTRTHPHKESDGSVTTRSETVEVTPAFCAELVAEIKKKYGNSSFKLSPRFEKVNIAETISAETIE
jgi:hypothetical protein